MVPTPVNCIRSFRFVRPLARLVDLAVAGLHGENTEVTVDPSLFAGLSLLNVRFLLAPAVSGHTIGLEVPDPSPIHVSADLSAPPVATNAGMSRLLHMNLEQLADGDPRDLAGMSSVLAQLEGMGLDSRSRTCRTFFVDRAPVCFARA